MTEPKSRAISKAFIYRQLRLWHGYLSALCFLALIFFAVTGILLNHPPDPDKQPDKPPPPARTLKLSPDEVKAITDAREPARELARIVGGKEKLIGAYQNGQAVERNVFVRMQGVRGSSDLIAHLDAGEVEVTVEPQDAVTIANELHRGERASPAWRFAIDVIAVALIAMSVLGYVIFLTLRFRLTTALVLTGLSAMVLIGVFVFAVS
jgi:hypothetical protein